VHWPGKECYTNTGRVILRQMEFNLERAIVVAKHPTVHSVQCGVTEDGLPATVIRCRGTSLEVRNLDGSAQV
jgi:hypothetical protein